MSVGAIVLLAKLGGVQRAPIYLLYTTMPLAKLPRRPRTSCFVPGECPNATYIIIIVRSFDSEPLSPDWEYYNLPFRHETPEPARRHHLRGKQPAVMALPSESGGTSRYHRYHPHKIAVYPQRRKVGKANLRGVRGRSYPAHAGHIPRGLLMPCYP